MPRRKKFTAKAGTYPATAEVDVEGIVDMESTEEISVPQVDQNGHFLTTHGRKARCHRRRERDDHDEHDLPDEPPPGWPR